MRIREAAENGEISGLSKFYYFNGSPRTRIVRSVYWVQTNGCVWIISLFRVQVCNLLNQNTVYTLHRLWRNPITQSNQEKNNHHANNQLRNHAKILLLNEQCLLVWLFPNGPAAIWGPQQLNVVLESGRRQYIVPWVVSDGINWIWVTDCWTKLDDLFIHFEFT